MKDEVSYQTSEQYVFYQETPKVAVDQYPFSKTVFEPSSLGRVTEQGAPGATWQPYDTGINGSGHTVQLQYRTNEDGEVRHWQVSGGGSFTTTAHKNPVGNAALFTGSNSYLQVGSTSTLKMTDVLTLEAWIFPIGSNSTVGGIIANREGEYEVARYADGTIRWAFANTSPGWTFINTGVVAPLHTWSHVAVVYGNGTVKTYLNGLLAHTGSVTGVIGDNASTQNDFRIGGRQAISQFFIGALDEVRIWKGIRTETEIRSNMYRVVAPATDLAGYWRMSEGEGTEVSDISTYSNKAFLVNAAWQLQGWYAPGTLYVTETRDEQGALAVEYKDRQGRVVMKKVQESASVSSSVSTGFMVTQYVYDLSGNLRLVIQPEGSKAVPATGSFTAPTTFINNWCFAYDYDVKGNLIAKQVPGAGKMRIIYNRLNHPVLMQDAEQALREEWIFTKYDVLVRPVMSGLVVLAGKTLETIQSELEVETVHFESDATGTAIGYTLNNAYPRNLTDSNLLTLTYYDKYTYSALSGSSYAFTGDNTKKAQGVRGQVTGTRVKNMDTGTWLTTASYYDQKYRPIQQVSQNHLGGTDRVTSTYDFMGNVLETLNSHQKGTATPNQVKNTMAYDHAGRLLTTEQQMNSELAVLLAKYEYNELGQLVDKRLHSIKGSDFLQSVDMRYNIRGWLTSINNAELSTDGRNNDIGDLFGLEMNYNQVSLKSYRHGESATAMGAIAQFNGNISEISWKSASDKVLRAYSYGYDKAGRITKADYYTAAGGAENYAMWNMSYDYNGNIMHLNRKGVTSAPTTTKVYGTMDDLTYHYGAGIAQSNRLLGVDDAKATAALHDFEEQNDRQFASGVEYGYDANGNMNRDDNKGISNALYNHLNLPSKVEIGTKGRIEFTYTATGQKLQKRLFTGTNTVPTTTTDYVSGFVYENGLPVFAHTSEGRVLYRADQAQKWHYEYGIKDHLGNLRVSFAPENELLWTMESEREEEQYKSGVFNNFRMEQQAMDHTHKTENATSTSNEVIRLNAGQHAWNRGTSLPGVEVSLQYVPVKPGAGLRINVHAKYINMGAGSQLDISTLAGIFMGTVSGYRVVQDAAGITQIFTSTGAVPVATLSSSVDANGTVPRASLDIVLLDKDKNPIRGASRPVTAEAAVTNAANFFGEHQELTLAFTEDEMANAAFLHVYLVHAADEEVDVFFDDLSVAQYEVQENHYDPWGLNLVGIERAGTPDHKFQYNGKEKQTELGLNWMDYGARMFDAQIGKFHTQDRFAEKYLRHTPYQYGGNNPVRFIDVNGDSLDIYGPNGVFMMTLDDGKKESTGLYFQNSKKSKNGSEKLTNGVSFGYNDAENDRKELKYGSMTVSMVNDSDINDAMTVSGVDNMDESKWTYIERESRPEGRSSFLSGTSEGKMDYFVNSTKAGRLHIVRSRGGEAVGYNPQDFGNFLWGQGGRRLGFDLNTLKVGANFNNAFNGKKDNPLLKEHTLLDSVGDQQAIRNGYYYNIKPQENGVFRPIIND